MGTHTSLASAALKREAVPQQEKTRFREKSVVRHTQDGKGLEEVSARGR